MSAVETILSDRLVAIVRSESATSAATIVATLLEGGVTAIEVSMTTPDALGVIAEFAGSAHPGVFIGAGTVLTARDAGAAVDAGSDFIVTPALTESLDEAVRLGVESLIGVFTASEAIEAKRRGASLLKLFPADAAGPAYLRALRGPLPDYSFIPVGGVTPARVGEYFDAGAVAVGAGSPLTGSQTAAVEPSWILEQLSAYRTAIDDWRGIENRG